MGGSPGHMRFRVGPLLVDRIVMDTRECVSVQELGGGNHEDKSLTGELHSQREQKTMIGNPSRALSHEETAADRVRSLEDRVGDFVAHQRHYQFKFHNCSFPNLGRPYVATSFRTGRSPLPS